MQVFSIVIENSRFRYKKKSSYKRVAVARELTAVIYAVAKY